MTSASWAARAAADRATGIDPRSVIPRALPAAATVRYAFPRHAMDGADARAALLDLVVRLGLLLRPRGQAARALTLTFRFAGNSSWEKTRRLPEPSPHDENLRILAHQLMDAAGLQRGRRTRLVLKGEDLIDADRVAQQISLDDAREAQLVAEAAVDRIRLLKRCGSRHLPIVRQDGRCAGLLDRVDVAVACAAPATSLSGLRVGDLLAEHKPVLIHVEETIRHAANLMSCTAADALPVLQEDGRLAGVLTAADIRGPRRSPGAGGTRRRAVAGPIYGAARASTSSGLPRYGSALTTLQQLVHPRPGASAELVAISPR
ncbi:CBS domain-containing protein [Streptomyces gibsoniae]|uniref:CBS domain-containing protein n=1 Tax=Streptomyces gibsoniae TaxID=3075529 RepID=A0ABU2U5X5_9ACTN|nr:CBS domain-containing protein [Streptomyces sp. DSM 41699]MDT0468629.1 CBS domain-containing protein [Streptomyces sp. DSM 41699]